MNAIATSNRSGVVYRHEDYCRITRRLVIDAIDLVASLGGFLIIFFPIARMLVTSADERELNRIAFLVGLPLFLTCMYSYFVPLKASPFGTLGYRLCRAKIVDAEGATPNLVTLTLRFTFFFFGPVNQIVDVLWLYDDDHRQTLRDKFAHTYVVEKKAEPIGRGKIGFKTYHILGTTFLFQEIGPLESSVAR